jgi:aspartate ammonia-lyase
MVKLAAVRANVDLGELEGPVAAALDLACRELADRRGDVHAALVVPLLQGGAGTSTNMNVNEVLANRTLELLGQPAGTYAVCHPNDHVNRSQSTNDVYPTALRVALLLRHSRVRAALVHLTAELEALARREDDVPKLGRTQLQDAVPMQVGQEVRAWSVRCRRALAELDGAAAGLLEVNLGGTAIGTGLAAPAGFAQSAVAHLREVSGLDLRLAEDLVAATTDSSALLRCSSALRAGAVALGKIANDLRLLGSGPRTGLAEYRLPPVQAGSSMMPGKVNPVHAMGLTQIAYFVAGTDQSVALAAANGQLETNNYMPLIAVSLFKAIETMRRAISMFDVHCVQSMIASQETSERNLLESTAIAPALKEAIGYERTAALVETASASGRPLIEVAVANGVMSRGRLIELLRESSGHPDAYTSSSSA